MARILVPAICDNCGIEFMRRKTLPPGQGRFCSRSCYKEWHIDGFKETRICVICDSEFKERPCYPRLTCSDECKSALYKQVFNTPEQKAIRSETGKRNLGKRRKLVPDTEKVCEKCGKNYTMSPKFTKQYREARRFCSIKCWYEFVRDDPANATNWKGGYLPYYGSNWLDQARKARKRDNYTCQRCGLHESNLSRKLDVHHIVPFREFGIARFKEANALSNLICYCGSCHIIVERSRT